jgi:hypothetical protein
MKPITRSTWIGEDNRDFIRVSLAFLVAGFEEPRLEVENGIELDGAYVSTIIDQYRAHLNETKVMAIIHWGLTSTVPALTMTLRNGNISVENMLDFYLDENRNG